MGMDTSLPVWACPGPVECVYMAKKEVKLNCILKGFHSQDPWKPLRIQSGHRQRQSSNSCPLKMLTTEIGKMLGRKNLRTRPNSLENPQQPLWIGWISFYSNQSDVLDLTCTIDLNRNWMLSYLFCFNKLDGGQGTCSPQLLCFLSMPFFAHILCFYTFHLQAQ